MTHDARPAPGGPPRTTAETFRAIAEELRALERDARVGRTRTPSAQIWTCAVLAFALGIGLARAVRVATLAERDR